VVEGIHVQPIWTYGFHMHENLKYGTEVDALFAVQFQVMNRNTWNSMPAEIQTAFMAAATEAAEAANAADRRGETEFKGKLREARMEIYTPSTAEKQLWQRVGEGLWEGQGGTVDRAVIQAMTALR
jgi:TRAP-type C4-dicarboxylate transport system substrate-binding protein